MIEFTETPLGWEWQDDRVHVFFGGLRSVKDVLRLEYPQYELRGVKQVHGPVVVEDTNQVLTGIEADGLMTGIARHALCILSADCVPIMIHDPKTNRVAALHAGWRGVANRIFAAALARFTNHEGLRIWVGPHIQRASFEVRQDALDLLLPASKAELKDFVTPSLSDRFRVDLNMILTAQAAEFGVRASQIQWLDLDTYADQRLHSFRRDGKNAGRQNSFIVLKS